MTTDPRLIWVRRSLWGCYFTLLAALAWSQLGNFNLLESSLTFWVAGMLLWAIKASPLLLAYYGLSKHYRKVSLYLAYACLFYFIAWTLVAFTPGQHWLGIVGVTASSGLFVSCLLHARWHREYQAIYTI